MPIDVIGHVYQSDTFDLYMLNANMIGQAFVYFVYIFMNNCLKCTVQLDGSVDGGGF